MAEMCRLPKVIELVSDNARPSFLSLVGEGLVELTWKEVI